MEEEDTRLFPFDPRVVELLGVVVSTFELEFKLELNVDMESANFPLFFLRCPFSNTSVGRGLNCQRDPFPPHCSDFTKHLL